MLEVGQGFGEEADLATKDVGFPPAAGLAQLLAALNCLVSLQILDTWRRGGQDVPAKIANEEVAQLVGDRHTHPGHLDPVGPGVLGFAILDLLRGFNNCADNLGDCVSILGLTRRDAKKKGEADKRNGWK